MAGTKEVANKLYEKTSILKKDALEVTNAVFEAIKELTQAGETVIVKGFGSFKLKTTAARTCRNPQTGGTVEVPAGVKLGFKPSK